MSTAASAGLRARDAALRCARRISLPPSGPLMAYLALLVAYSAAQIALGALDRSPRADRRRFLRRRPRLGPGLIFSTMLAANIGAGSTVGATGLGYRDGLAGVWWVGSAALGSLVLALWIGPAIRRVAAAHDLRTVGDFLEHRYDSAWPCDGDRRAALGRSLFILAGQLIAIASILNAIVGLPPAVGCAGRRRCSITVYFTAGGLLTSAWVNVVQLTVKLAGLRSPCRSRCRRPADGVPCARSQPAPDYWNLAGRPLRADLPGAARAGLRRLARPAPEDLRRAGRSRRAPRRRRNALGLLVYALVPVLIGMIARAAFPALDAPRARAAHAADARRAAVVGAHRPGRRVLGGAERRRRGPLHADDVAVAGSLQALREPRGEDGQVLRVARSPRSIAGALGVIVAIVAADVVNALTIFYTLLGVGLFVPILAGLFSRRPSAAGALAAIVAGVRHRRRRCSRATAARAGGFTPAMLGLLGAFAAYVVAAGVRRWSR